MRWSQSIRSLIALVGALVLSVGVSCDDELAEPSLLETLRIIAVTADTTYPQPGDEVTLRMTYADVLGVEPRPIEVAWISGCVDPPGGAYYGCFPELVEALSVLAAGGEAGPYRMHREVLDPEWSGAPDAAPFAVTVPADALDSGQASATAFVFFTVCAGQIQPAVPQPDQGAVSFPLTCVDADGHELGADSFVPGFAELFVYRDGRTNANPPVEGIMVGSVLTGSNPEVAPTVRLCPEREDEGCSPAFGPGANNQAQEACATYRIQAIVPDVAEGLPGETDADGAPLRETVWVSYYADGGEFERNEALVSDSAAGYQGSFESAWTPPSEPGLVTLWAVARDSRGGASVRRALVRVE